jgi:hypothetical protein
MGFIEARRRTLLAMMRKDEGELAPCVLSIPAQLALTEEALSGKEVVRWARAWAKIKCSRSAFFSNKILESTISIV